MGKFPRKQVGYKCLMCDEWYESQDEADACCYSEKVEEDSVKWECIECGEMHDDRDDAYNCCG